jgi:hypothetical protein
MAVGHAALAAVASAEQPGRDDTEASLSSRAFRATGTNP